MNLKLNILESNGRRSRRGYQKGVSYDTGVYKRYYFHTFEAFNFDMNHPKMIMVEYVVITVTHCGRLFKGVTDRFSDRVAVFIFINSNVKIQEKPTSE